MPTPTNGSAIRCNTKEPCWIAKFSPNGKSFVTASSGGTVTLWDASTQRRVRDFQHNTRVHCVSFSPDGKFLAGRLCVRRDNFLGRSNWPAHHITSSSSKTRFLTSLLVLTAANIASASRDGTVRLWKAPPPPIEGDVKRIVLWTQVLTAQELDQSGLVRFLDRETWLDRRSQLQALGGPPIR